MTTPSIFSDVAANSFVCKSLPQGVLASKATVTVPASTASGTNLGFIRFQKGFKLLSLAISSADLDTGTSVTLNVGYLYDGTTGESASAFLSGSTIAQTGTSAIWPTAAGLLTGVSFSATGDGYISITTGGGSTTTAGDIQVIATFTYDWA